MQVVIKSDLPSFMGRLHALSLVSGIMQPLLQIGITICIILFHLKRIIGNTYLLAWRE